MRTGEITQFPGQLMVEIPEQKETYQFITSQGLFLFLLACFLPLKKLLGKNKTGCMQRNGMDNMVVK